MLVRHLDTPEVCLEGAQNRESRKCATPEVRLEVVPKESLSFSTTPRSALVSDENALAANPAYSRGPSL